MPVTVRRAGRPRPKRGRLVTFVVLMIALGCVLWFSAVPRAGRVRPLAYCPGDIGVSPAWILNESDDDLNRDMVEARNAGASRFKFDVDWSLVESKRGSFDWAPIDRVVNAIIGHGMRPLGVLAYTPQWAQPPGLEDLPDAPANHSPPANVADYAHFAEQAAKRYARTITDWEIWNEPNGSNFWVPSPDAASYTRLLVAASVAIRSVQPDANIIAGAMAPGEDTATGEIDPVTFVRRIYDAGGQNAFTAISIHPYTYPWMPDDPSTSDWSTFQKIPRLRDLMVSKGDGGKPIWITEFGAPTGSDPASVSREAQADYLRIGIVAARKLGYIPVILIYAIRDSGVDPTDPEKNFGLLTHDFKRKSGYYEISKLSSLC